MRAWLHCEELKTLDHLNCEISLLCECGSTSQVIVIVIMLILIIVADRLMASSSTISASLILRIMHFL